MSLINDALKRASTAKTVPAEPAAVPAMQPAPEPARGSTGPLPIVLFIVGVGALLVSAAFWLKSKGTPQQNAAIATPPPQIATPPPSATVVEKASPPQPLPSTTAPVATPLPAPTLTAAPVVSAPVSPVSPSETVVVTEPPVQESPRTKPAVATAAKPAPAEPSAAPPVTAEQPTLNLQAIYYRMKGPTVVINGKTLKIGDSISGARLVAIERNFAVVEVQGTRLKLALQ